MATTAAAVSKDQQQALNKVAQARGLVQESLKSFTLESKDKPALVKRLAALDAKVEECKQQGPKAVRDLLALVKSMQDLDKDVLLAVKNASLVVMRRDFTAQAKARLAETLLLVGQLGDPALVRPMQPEQAAMRAKVDKIEALKNDQDAVFALDDLDDALVALVARCRKAAALSAWLKSGYQVLMAKAESAIKAVPHERVRRVLRAEIDFIDADKIKMLGKLDAGIVKTVTAAPLQALQRQATRMTALWTALDREMLRVGGLIKDAGSPADLGSWLKALAQEKAEGWPKAGTAGLLDKTVDAFEKDLGELAQTAKRAAAQAKA